MFKDIVNFFTFKGYPKQIKFIMWNEGAERYAFYGMRAILVIYMIRSLKFEEHIASAVYHYFNAFLYFTPLLGAYLSDKYFGKYKVIITFSFIYIIGMLFLAYVPTVHGLTIGLCLIALGAGGIKPCVSAFMADQLDSNSSGYEVLKAKAFSMFYFMINFGSFFSTIITPLTREYLGAQVAFTIPAVLMFLSILVFLIGSKNYVHIMQQKEVRANMFHVVWSALKNRKQRASGLGFLEGALKEHSKEVVDGVFNILQVLKIFLFLIVFWSLFDQQGSTWIVQASKMNLNFFGLPLEPDLIPFFNPMLVMILIPFFNKFVYPFVNKYLFNLTPFRKIGIGIFSSALSFAVVGFFQHILDSGTQINVVWQLLAYILLTVGEIMITITGMDFAYSQAPKNMRSTVISAFWFTVFLGNLLAAYINKINVFEGAYYFLFFAVLTFVVGLIFIPVATTYKHREMSEN